MGQPYFYVGLLPLLLWCVDVGLGARVGVLLLLSSQLNAALKGLFHQPRPCDFDPSLQLTWFEGYGLPSGHAQFVVLVWGAISAWAGKRWLWALSIAMMVLVGFSRVYLGVHFPTDVVAGWAVGGVSLGLCLALQGPAEKALVELDLGWQLVLATTVPLALFVASPTESSAAAMGALLGAATGFALAHRYVPFGARGSWQQRALRLVVGGAVVVLLYLGVRQILPVEESPPYLVARFLQFVVIGLWGGLGAPWLFKLLGLAESPEKP